MTVDEDGVDVGCCVGAEMVGCDRPSTVAGSRNSFGPPKANSVGTENGMMPAGAESLFFVSVGVAGGACRFGFCGTVAYGGLITLFGRAINGIDC